MGPWHVTVIFSNLMHPTILYTYFESLIVFYGILLKFWHKNVYGTRKQIKNFYTIECADVDHVDHLVHYNILMRQKMFDTI